MQNFNSGVKNLLTRWTENLAWDKNELSIQKKFFRLSHNFQYRDLNIILLRLWKYINYARSHGGTLETVEVNPANLELVHTLSHKASHLKINWRLEICKFFLRISMTYAWKVKSTLQNRPSIFKIPFRISNQIRTWFVQT